MDFQQPAPERPGTPGTPTDEGRARHTADRPGRAALWTEDEYQRAMAELIAVAAPAVFALVVEYEDRSDGRICAWVLDFRDWAEVIGSDGGLRMSAASPDQALATFRRLGEGTARLVRIGQADAHPA